MRRRSFVTAFGVVPVLTRLVSAQGKTLRGTLAKDAQGRPALKTGGGRLVTLTADEPGTLVLNDPRLAGADFEVAGTPQSESLFAVDPIHTYPLQVYRDGKKLAVSYWCDICYIRTWSPGKCWCCQEDTKLDPIDPATLDNKSK